MTSLRIISRMGSKARRSITRNTDIRLYKGNKKYPVDAIINYGLAGKHMESYLRKYKSASRVPMINRKIGLSKLHVINLAKEAGINVPESKLMLSKDDDRKDFIEKRFSSIGGKGIRKAKGKNRLEDKYYQRFISDRKYELRVHAFLWTEDWVIQKRIGPEDQIAWNFSQGGRFITVKNPDDYGIFRKAREISAKILELVGMSFGAVDFVVDENYELWFLEINSSPGFTELSEEIYIDAFNKLKEMPLKKVIAYTS